MNSTRAFSGDFSDRKQTESYFSESVMRKDIAAIEHESRLEHFIIDSLKVEILEFVPLCEYSNTMGSFAGIVSIPDDNKVGVFGTSKDICADLFFRNLGIIDINFCPLGK